MAIREIIECINASDLSTNVASISVFAAVAGDLARILISAEIKVNAPKNKKNAPAAESADKKRKRTRDKLIRLDDLIPEKDVKGGHKLPFGVTDPNTNNPK